MRGPIDYIVVGFRSDEFNGSILKQLNFAEDNDLIKVLDVALITKDEDGSVKAAEQPSDELADAIKGISADEGVITDEDIEEVGEMLEPGTAAGLLIIEHLWAIPLKIAILENGGEVIAEGRIHPDANEEIK